MRSRLLILAAAALWSTAGAAIKLTALNAWQVSAGRSLVAALAVAAMVPASRVRPRPGVLGVALSNAVTVILFVVATKLTTAANAIFLQETAPLWVLLLAPLLLGERPSRGELLSIPIYAAGLALFFVDDLTAGQIVGKLCALGSGFAFGVTIVGLRHLREEGPGALLWGSVIAAAVTLPLWGTGPSAAPHDLALLLFLGVFQLALAYVCFAKGLTGVPAVEASLLMLLEPVLSPIWAYLIVGERPGPWALTGGGIVLAATGWRTLVPALARRDRPSSAAP
ncbi:MAG TPA: EamA family transporter [Anaeromyxobacteraceae bacterium]|nr:EamA family transporter [Anaeromyxobacteraceae bacterium]